LDETTGKPVLINKGKNMGITISGGLNMGSMSISTPLPAIGSSYGGGYVAAYISMNQDGVATHMLILAPKSSQATNILPNGGTDGLSSLINGYQNTVTGANAGSPSLSYARNLTVGGYTDWYLPAYYEWDAIYYNLKPTTDNNITGNNGAAGVQYGVNPYAVPKRTTAWTTTSPTMTTVSAFQTGNSEAFGTATYLGSFWISSWWPFATSGIHPNMPNGAATYIGFGGDGPQHRAIRKIAL